MTMTARFISGWPRVRRVWFFLVSAIMLAVPISAAAGVELLPRVDRPAAATTVPPLPR